MSDFPNSFQELSISLVALTIVTCWLATLENSLGII
jgi:hypothetical protein